MLGKCWDYSCVPPLPALLGFIIFANNDEVFVSFFGAGD
jgi:hypothetical protein